MSRSDLHREVRDFISPVHTVIKITETVDEALRSIREHRIDEKIFYFYVVDQEFKLRGVVSTRALLLSRPHMQICDIMETEIISICAAQTLQKAMELLTNQRLLAVPVIDDTGRLLGIIDIQLYLEEAVDVAQARRSSTDLFQLLGLTLEEGKTRSVWKTYKNRMPWIFCNMAGGLTCAVISASFELVLEKVILLAFFIPLVLTLSESISMQSMTYSLQLLHRPRISLRRIMVSIMTEWKMVILLALTSGIVVGCTSLLWGQGIPPGIAIAIGIIISVTISGTVGASIPLILHARRLDPKVAAGPVVLMFVDVFTTAVYLGLSTLLLL
ncbi:MAG: Magnesium transporter MgtE [Chlamydiae bacterium]|nr:Magnesium transporter MgtE [Chlamydiota bacterium]